MTVNERLAVRGMTNEWDAAVRSGDRDTMILILRRVAMPNAVQVADVVLADPGAYGF